MVLYNRRIDGEAMKKIVIEISDKSLSFKYRTNKPVPNNLLNTNVISNNELVFSADYINDNSKIVGMFINDLAKEKEIDTAIVSLNEIAELIIPLLKRVEPIHKIVLNEDTNLSYSLCEAIVSNKYITNLNCYAIPTFMIEILDKKNIEVSSRSEVLFTSLFMQQNNLTSFSKIYYKSSIRISEILKNDDIDDLKSFLSINKYLRTVHLEKGYTPDIESICALLSYYKRKNINIEIHDDINDVDTIDKLKKINKKYKSKYKIKLSLIYSKDYLEKNYLKQIIFTTLKLCSLIIFLIIGSIFGYIPNFLNVIYILFCAFCFIISLTRFTSALTTVVPDFAQLLTIVIQLCMWFTPIIWNLSMLSEKWRVLFKIFPFTYLVEGFRQAFMEDSNIITDQNFMFTAIFWAITLIIFMWGNRVFKKAKKDFADVL